MVKKSSRLEIQKNYLSRLGVKLWNEIPRYITDLPEKTFKLKEFFANCYLMSYKKRTPIFKSPSKCIVVLIN